MTNYDNHNHSAGNNGFRVLAPPTLFNNQSPPASSIYNSSPHCHADGVDCCLELCCLGASLALLIHHIMSCASALIAVITLLLAGCTQRNR